MERFFYEIFLILKENIWYIYHNSMKTKLFKTYIALFFLLLFSGGKAFGYHTLTHDHDIEIVDCEVCDKALLDQFSPFEGGNTEASLETIPHIINQEIQLDYSSELYATELFTALFSRPPPTLA